MGTKKLADKFETLYEDEHIKEKGFGLRVVENHEEKIRKSHNSKELMRLISILRESETKTINLIKSVVQSKKKQDEIILKIILHSLDNIFLRKISNFLSQEEKVYLFNSNFQLPTEEEIKDGAVFLESKLNQLNLIDTKLTNETALNKLLSMSNDEVREFVENQPKIGAKALSLFPAAKVSKILEGYDENTLNNILNQVEELRSDQEVKELEEYILAFKSKKFGSGTFLKKFPLIIAELDIDRENFIVEKMRLSELDESQIEVIIEAKPMKLIAKMGDEFFSKVGEGLSLEKKVKIILSSSQDFIDNIENGFFPSGTQVYEMYKIEEENLLSNEAAQKTLIRNESIIWREFAKVCRESLNSSEAYMEQFRNIVYDWASSS